VEAGLGDVPVAILLEEDVLVVLPQRLVDVHARAVVLEDRLGHEGHGLSVPFRRVLGAVLVPHDVVRHLGQRREQHGHLGLSGGPHLVVVDLHLHAHALQRKHHLRADVLLTVHGRY